MPLTDSTARPQETREEEKRSESKANSIEKTDNEAPLTKVTENVRLVDPWGENKADLQTDEKFAFKEPSYYYEALGDVQENDILGRVVADGAEMFAVERKVDWFRF